MADLTGADATQLLPTRPGDLIEQLNAAAGKGRTAPWAGGILGVLVLATLPFGLLLLMLAVPLVWWLALHDQAKRNVVVFYEVADHPAAWFGALNEALMEYAASQGKWRINAQGGLATVHQRKINGNASSLLERITVTVSFDHPKHPGHQRRRPDHHQRGTTRSTSSPTAYSSAPASVTAT
ncbi:hypothetical protein [Nocardia sp. MW-W600-9]